MDILKRIRKRWIVLALSLLALTLAFRLPDPLFDHKYATVVESSEGQLLAAMIAADGQWRFPPIESTPRKFRECLLAFEDNYFYQHPGINPFSLFRAMRQNIKAGRVVQGGSTLTMQVIRLSRKGRDRTIVEKIIEMGRAIQLEMKYSKEEILNLYTSHAPFGGNVVGLSAASWRYYYRSPELLSWGEAAALAVLPNSPALVYPGKNSEFLMKKRNRVLDLLQAKGVIDASTCRLAKSEALPGKPVDLPKIAPRLLTRILNDGQAGKKVRTSIKALIHQRVKEKVVRHQRIMEGNMVHNVAALVVEINSGRAIAYVGNVDSEGDHSQETDLIVSKRSTGSLLKPILYAVAVDEGLILPGQLLPDIPMYYRGFSPKNFDRRFHGAVPADQALIRSLNVPFVYLLREYGYERFHQRLKDFGFPSLSEPASHYGLSMILGGAESSLWDLTALYAGFARTLYQYNQLKGDKRYTEDVFFPNTYLTGPIGNHQLRRRDEGAINAASVWLMFRTMQELRRPDEFSDWKVFSSSVPIAWKTGTSFGFRDAWAIGINDKYVVGIWVGNADGEGRAGLTGIRSAAPLMFDVFTVLDGKARFPKPLAGTRQISTCINSGYHAGGLCEDVKTEIIPASVTNTNFCPYHTSIHLDADSLNQVNSSCYPVRQMVHMPWFVLPPVQAWYFKQYNPGYKEPPEYDKSCTNVFKNDFFELIYPRQFTRVFVPREINGAPGRTVFEAAHRNPEATLFWYIDDRYIGSTERFHQMGVHPDKGKHLLHLVDDQGREAELYFEVINERKDH